MGTEPSREATAAAGSVENRFLTINRDRLRRIQDTLTPRQRDFLELLPFLFQTNHPALPGYVSADTPFGVCDYVPTQATMRAAQRICQVVEYDRRPPRRLGILGLYMMGSPGSIAYSRTSDLDFWLCHEPELEPEAVEELVRKANDIEKFAAGLDLEVHFFVFDVTRFRNGETISLSNESSGSSQHYLLLDEFYRSSVMLAGLKPLWWRVPSSEEANYEAFTAKAIESGRIVQREYLDFGAVPGIPVEEFFGAAVWQLYKSIGAPYKSVLKLLLNECYAAEHPNIGLLCTQYKHNVEKGDLEIGHVDPYVLMYEKIERYLTARQDSVRLEVLRRSFYLKTNLRLSDRFADDDWRREVLREMTSSWGWGEDEPARLDGRATWRIDTATEERRDVINTLKDSYAALSQFGRQHAGDRKITEHDLHVLGRKLYAAFEKKPAKVDVVTQGICINPVEPNLSLHEILLEDGKRIWAIFEGVVKPGARGEHKPMRRAASVAEILVWCHLNGMVGRDTLWHLFCDRSTLSITEIRRLNAVLSERLRPREDSDAPAEDLGARPRLVQALLFANLGIDPFAGSSLRGVLTSDHTDAFQYGGRRINLVQGIDLVFTTSWDETFCFHYTGPDALLQALAECLQWLPDESSRERAPAIDAHCFTSDHATQIAERVERTANDALAFLVSNAGRYRAQYVLEVEDQFHRIRFDGAAPQVDSLSGHSALVVALGDAASGSCNRLRFDAACRRAGILPQIYSQNREGCVQIFALRRGGKADVYVLDERGVLLVQSQECFQTVALLQHYRRFLEAALPRCIASPDADNALQDLEIDTCEILQADGRIGFRSHLDDLSATSGYLSLQVLADADSDGHQQFTIYCNHQEFSTWEHGGSLFVEVAKFVHARRSAGETYPIYITDLDLSTRFRNQVGIQSLRPYDLLNYKKRIEYQLTRALGAESSEDKSVRLAS